MSGTPTPAAPGSFETSITPSSGVLVTVVPAGIPVPDIPWLVKKKPDAVVIFGDLSRVTGEAPPGPLHLQRACVSSSFRPAEDRRDRGAAEGPLGGRLLLDGSVACPQRL